MPTVARRTRVPYTAEQMFDLVNDVARYPEFLRWCKAARVESPAPDVVEASLDVGFLGFNKSFRTRNTLERPARIDMTLVSGPFRKLHGEWRFTAVPGGCEVALTVTFEVAASPFGLVFSRAFEDIAGSQMNAFAARAEQVYGPPRRT